MFLNRTIIGTAIYKNTIELLPPTNTGSLGSFYFPGTPGSNLNYTNDGAFALGTGNFTVEWYNWISSDATNSFPRIFSLGSYPSAEIGCSVEGGSYYIWFNSNYIFSFEVTAYNVWAHIAIVRESGTLSIYYDGTRIYNASHPDNLTNGSSPLFVGMEEGDNYTSFQGLITDFHVVKGTALYSGTSFQTTTISSVQDTVILVRPDNPLGPAPTNPGDLVTVFENGPYD